MSAPAVISGDFATYKHVQGRKIMQLVIEVPAEMASAVFAALGTPGCGEAIPVALARLVTAPEPREQPCPVKRPSSPLTKFADLPYSQQAALRCQEPAFAQFLDEKHHDVFVRVGHDPAEAVRQICAVESRAKLNGSDAGPIWRRLDDSFWAWQRGMR